MRRRGVLFMPPSFLCVIPAQFIDMMGPRQLVVNLDVKATGGVDKFCPVVVVIKILSGVK